MFNHFISLCQNKLCVSEQGLLFCGARSSKKKRQYKKNLPGNPGRPMNCRINCNQNQSEILRHPSVHRNAGIDSGIDCGLDIGIVIELDLDISRIFLEGNLVGEASV